MRNFNKIGRVVAETIVDKGITVRLTKVWPWQRRSLSGGMKYLVTAFDDEGFEFYNNYHSYPVLYSYVTMKCREYRRPKAFTQYGVNGHSFLMNACLSVYFSKVDLQNGRYLVMIPASDDVRDSFWKTKGPELIQDYRSDCYALNLLGFNGSIKDLVLKTNSEFPGRYFEMKIDDTSVEVAEVK